MLAEKLDLNVEALQSVQTAFTGRATENTAPYRHWVIENVLPQTVVDDVLALDWPSLVVTKDLNGTRESFNDQRHYIDAHAQELSPSCEALAQAFQDRSTIDLIEKNCDVDLTGSYLRIEYTQDTDGFWLEPHTDIGAKLFTMLIYLSKDPRHANLGTDYYADADTHLGAIPFASNRAMVFVPGEDTWHGFEKRTIHGVRTSLIINYVKEEWRAREQLAFPNTPITK